MLQSKTHLPSDGRISKRKKRALLVTCCVLSDAGYGEKWDDESARMESGGRRVGKAGFSYGEYGRCEARCLLSCPMLTSTSAPSSMCVCACVFTYACLPHRQIPPPLPSNNCSHSMFEHKHTPLSLSLQLSVCAPASM